MLTDAQLRQKATSSPSLLFDPVVWSQLCMAEVLLKLMSPSERPRMKKLTQRMAKR